MNKNIFFPFILIMIIFSLISCSSEFSKYEKRGKNDVEEAELRGKVKEVKTYKNGELSEIQKFNKYGFLTIRVYYDFDDYGDFESQYKYDEYGNLIEEIDNHGNGKKVYHYFNEYDDHNNITKTTRTLTEDSVKGQNEFMYSYENIYENGNLIKRNIRNSESTSKTNYRIEIYNLGGRLNHEQYVDEYGNLREAKAYEYDADGSLYRNYFLYPDGEVHHYWEEEYELGSRGSSKKPVRRFHIFPGQNNYAEQIIRYNDKGDRVYQEENSYKLKTEYKYDSQNNWIYRKDTMVTFSKDKEKSRVDEEKREIVYY